MFAKYILGLIVFIFCINIAFGQVIQAEKITIENISPIMTKSELVETVATDTGKKDSNIEEDIVEDIVIAEPKDSNESDTIEHDPGIAILEIIGIVEDSDQQVGFGDGVKGTRLPSEQSDPDRPIITGETESEEAGDNTRRTVRDQDIPTLEKKPKEIVVVDPKSREEREWIDILSTTPSTEEQLGEYIEATIALDEAIEEITVTDETVTMKYKQPAKLFGFDIDYTLTAIVDEEGVIVKYPWWVAFTRNNAKKLEAELENTNIDIQSSRQKIIQTLSDIMKK